MNFQKKQISIPKEHIQQITKTLEEHQYSYIKVIGKGGFGSVHLVSSNKYIRNFVAKVVLRKSQNEVQSNEIVSLMSLIHPHIISMYEYFYDETFLYMILEYCPGGSLSTYVKEYGKIKPPQLYQIAAQIISAVKECHSHNIAHRDIKPSNILIDANGRVKLSDFGLSVQNYDNGNDFCGSTPFMAPEIFKKMPYDPKKADVWAIGITLYYIGTGRTPWKGIGINEMELAILSGFVNFGDCDLEPEFIEVLKEMLTVSPKYRISLDCLLTHSFLGNYVSFFGVGDNPDVASLDQAGGTNCMFKWGNNKTLSHSAPGQICIDKKMNQKFRMFLRSGPLKVKDLQKKKRNSNPEQIHAFNHFEKKKKLLTQRSYMENVFPTFV